jgi:hypothetical protein
LSSGSSEFEPELDRTPVVAELYAVGELLHDKHPTPATLTEVLRAGGVGNIVGVEATTLITDPYRNTIGNPPGPDLDFFRLVALIAVPNRIRNGFRDTDQDIWVEIPADRIFSRKVINERLYFADTVEIGW